MYSQAFSLVDLEYYLLILVRIATFVFIAPFFGQRGIPNRTKIGLAAVIALLVFYVMHPEEAVEYADVFGYGALVFKEALTGLLIGYSANICNYILMFAGNIIDMDIGLSMVSQFDPTSNVQVTITGNIYNQVVLAFLVISNMHHYILRAFIDSFSLLPLGGTVFRSDVLLEGMIVYFSDLFILGFRIMLPIFAAMLIVNVVLGIMAKVAPQMNMFAIGVQIKIMVGLVILMVMVFLFPEVVEMVFKEIRLQMANMMDGLHE